MKKVNNSRKKMRQVGDGNNKQFFQGMAIGFFQSLINKSGRGNKQDEEGDLSAPTKITRIHGRTAFRKKIYLKCANEKNKPG